MQPLLIKIFYPISISVGPQSGFGMEIYFVSHLTKHSTHVFGQCWKKWIMSKGLSTKYKAKTGVRTPLTKTEFKLYMCMLTLYTCKSSAPLAIMFVTLTE